MFRPRQALPPLCRTLKPSVTRGNHPSNGCNRPAMLLLIHCEGHRQHTVNNEEVRYHFNKSTWMSVLLFGSAAAGLKRPALPPSTICSGLDAPWKSLLFTLVAAVVRLFNKLQPLPLTSSRTWLSGFAQYSLFEAGTRGITKRNNPKFCYA